jgi:hypothetical protein
MQLAIPALLVVHVFAATFWYGSAAVIVRFVVPSAIAETRFPYALAGAGGITVATGLALLGLISGGFSPAFMTTLMGLTLAFGAACAVVAFVLAVLFARGVRTRTISVATMVFLTFALLAMILNRYV